VPQPHRSRHDIADVKRGVAEAEHDIADVKCGVAEAEHDIADVKREVTEVEHDVADVKHKVAEAVHDIADVKCGVAEAGHDIADVKREVAGTKHDVADAEHEVADVTACAASRGPRSLPNGPVAICSFSRHLVAARECLIRREQAHDVVAARPTASRFRAESWANTIFEPPPAAGPITLFHGCTVACSDAPRLHRRTARRTGDDKKCTLRARLCARNGENRMRILRLFAGRTAGAGQLAAIVLVALSGLAPASTCIAAVVSPFSNTAPITINDAPPPPPPDVAKATPYPSVIHVSGIGANTITKVQVILSTFSHTFPDDVDILLVAPDGTRSIVMSDAGGGNPGASNLQLTFSATDAAPVPDNTAINDTAPLRPANYAAGDASGITDIFPSPGPGTVQLEPADFDAFNGINPNGDWSLYVVDDSNGDSGSILGGWTLVLTVPTVYTVTKVEDTNDGTCNSDCSLREAIAAAGDGDLIRFASPLFDSSQTITLGGTQLDLTKSVTIEGPGADRLSISANYSSRVFSVASGTAVTMTGMTIRDGSADAGGGMLSTGQLTLQRVAFAGNKAIGSNQSPGGALYLTANGNLNGCTFSDNLAGQGGAIFFANSADTLRLANVTVSGNRANAGGGLYALSDNASALQVDILNSTFANNTGNSQGGGIALVTQDSPDATLTTTLRNTIIANNIGGNLVPIASSGGAESFVSRGFNLTNDAPPTYLTDATDVLGVDPQLGPLNNNGGHVETRALLGGSPALDAGHSSGYPKDQRGVSRSYDALGALSPPGDYSDIGAAEMHALFVSTTADSDAGSLRQAMTVANGSSPAQVDILFDPNVFGTAPQTINLAGALPDINTSLSINGPGTKLLTVRRDTGGNYRVFNAGGGFEVAFSGLTISNGVGGFGGGALSAASRLSIAQIAAVGNSETGGLGGGAVALVGADGTIKDSSFSGNGTAGAGGGIYFEGSNSLLRVINTTVSGNNAAFGGGIGILTGIGATTELEMTSSTIANNNAGTHGGVDVFAQNDPAAASIVRLRNSIVANNTLPNFGTGTANGGSASIVSLGYNLTDDPTPVFLDQLTDWVNTDPLLRPLADNGGPTKTHALKPGSPALDSGDRSGSNTDQRGLVRPYDQPGVTNISDGSDIGALEQDDTLFRDGFDG
jgi:CSLREA domain-containing protein